MSILKEMSKNPKFTNYKNKPMPATGGTGEKSKPLMSIGDAKVVIVGIGAASSCNGSWHKTNNKHEKRSDYVTLTEISKLVMFNINLKSGVFSLLPPPDLVGSSFAQKNGARKAKYWKKDSPALLKAIELIKKKKEVRV